jgi:putative FmdB family regulatory protein
MPFYDYSCSSCNHTFEKKFSISERKIPESEPCPECNQLTVTQAILNANEHIYGIGAEAKNNAGGFKDVLTKIHERSKHMGSTLNNYI